MTGPTEPQLYDLGHGDLSFRHDDDPLGVSVRFTAFEGRRIVHVDHGDLRVEVYVSRTGRSHRVWVNGDEVRTDRGTP